MPSISTFLARCAVVACVAGIARASYSIQDTYDSTNFFDEFNFFTGSDPTHGFVDYIGAAAANTSAIAGYSNNAVYMGVDHTTMNPSNGRESVRLSSNKAYTHGLFIADIAHMPGSICGVWPAFWTFGPNWPSSGEIDIIEGVNTQSTDSITLHTSSGCSLSNSGSAAGNTFSTSDCNAGNGNDGCSQSTNNGQNYGNGFNAIGGGVYAMEWTSSAISIYFFPRSGIPSDISEGNPNPSSWGTPTATFGGSGCSIDSHFMNHNIVFDTTFCGDWAGNVFSQTCGSLAPSCQAYVAQNPSAFTEAYWLINSVKVYSQGGSNQPATPAKAVASTPAAVVAATPVQVAPAQVAPAQVAPSPVAPAPVAPVAVAPAGVAPAAAASVAAVAPASVSVAVSVSGSSNPAPGIPASQFGQPLQESDFDKREDGLVPQPFMA